MSQNGNKTFSLGQRYTFTCTGQVESGYLKTADGKTVDLNLAVEQNARHWPHGVRVTLIVQPILRKGAEIDCKPLAGAKFYEDRKKAA